MFKRLSRAVIAFVLAAGIFSVALPADTLAYAEGACWLNDWPSGNTGQWYFQKTTTSYFDSVCGYVTDRSLYPCSGLSYQGWSFAAAVNLQGNGIYQLGILQEAGKGGAQNYFVYTEFDGSGSYVKLTSIRPVKGTRYQFHIWKTSGSHIGYSIARSDGSILWDATSTRSWPSGLNLVWWGYETANSKSQAGINPTASAADMVGQYRVSGGSLTTKTSISPICQVPVHDCHAYADMLVSGASNQIFNVRGYLTYP